MAKYGDNPFGDPEGSNPFNDGTHHASAFAAGTTSQNFIPAAQAVTSPVRQPASTAGQADFASPFGFYNDAPPAYGSMASPTGQMDSANRETARANTEEFRRRQEDLERKAAELDRRETQLRSGATIVKENNWPAIRCGRIGPCFYQDFDVDIAIEYKRLVKGMYYLWMVYSLMLVLNMSGCIVYLVLYGGTGTATVFGLSVLWVVLFPAISFLFWYRPLYKAFRSDSSMNFFIFFIIFSFQVGVSVVQCLGIDGAGTAGIINGLSTIHHGEAAYIGVGAFMVCIGILFGVLALFDFIMLVKIHRIYRTTGASFSKAKQEFAVTSLTNPHVQSVAVDVAGRAAQDAFTRGSVGQF